MTWLVIIACYFLGSFPSAYLAGKILKGKDIRQMGDGNMGAQNAFKELSPMAGMVVGAADVGKGALAIVLARSAGLDIQQVLLAGAAAVAGHNWPVFLGFRGGRGMATTIGILLVLVTKPLLVVAGPTILVLLLTKNITAVGVTLFVPLPFIGWWLGVPGILISYGIILPVIVGLTHWYTVSRAAARLRATGSPYAR